MEGRDTFSFTLDIFLWMSSNGTEWWFNSSLLNLLHCEGHTHGCACCRPSVWTLKCKIICMTVNMQVKRVFLMLALFPCFLFFLLFQRSTTICQVSLSENHAVLFWQLCKYLYMCRFPDKLGQWTYRTGLVIFAMWGSTSVW